MKRSLWFVLGLLIALMSWGSAARAQSSTYLCIQTASGLDRCSIVTATNPLPTTGTITGTVTVTPTNPVGTTPTDRTVTSATGSSQTVMAANTTRKSMTIVNTGNANCGINPTGGTAAIGGAGTITLAPFGAYTPRVPTLSAVTAICTAAQPLYADES